MRTARWVSATVLILYCAIALGGVGLHLWECGGDCHSSTCESQVAKHHEGHCYHHHDHDAGGEENKKPAAPKNRHHDSSTCHTCQTLAQAQEQPCEVELVLSGSVVPFSPTLGRLEYVADELSLIQPRGPPAA